MSGFIHINSNTCDYFEKLVYKRGTADEMTLYDCYFPKTPFITMDENENITITSHKIVIADDAEHMDGTLFPFTLNFNSSGQMAYSDVIATYDIFLAPCDSNIEAYVNGSYIKIPKYDNKVFISIAAK